MNNLKVVYKQKTSQSKEDREAVVEELKNRFLENEKKRAAARAAKLQKEDLKKK